LIAIGKDAASEYEIHINGEYFQESREGRKHLGGNRDGIVGYGDKFRVFPDHFYGAEFKTGCSTPVYLLLLGDEAILEPDGGSMKHSYDWCSRDQTAFKSADNTIDECYCLMLCPTKSRGGFRRSGYIELSSWYAGDNTRLLRLWELLQQQFRSHDVPREHFESIDDNFFYTITLV
jgi:hypothetical protein